MIDATDAGRAREVEQLGRAPGGRRHTHARCPSRGDARPPHSRRGRVIPSLHVIPVTGIGEIGRDAPLGPMIADAAESTRARRSRPTTASSSPRRSCRRPRAGSCRSTPTTSKPGPRSSSESRAHRAPARRPGHLRDPPRVRLRERRRRPVERRRRVRGAAPRRRRPLGPPRPQRDSRRRGRHDVAVIVSDTFGRPWRLGLTDVAIGVAGIAAVVDLRGQYDDRGQRAPGHRGRDRRRDRGGRRAGDGQESSGCRPRSSAASTPRGSAADRCATSIRPPEDDLFR